MCYFFWKLDTTDEIDPFLCDAFKHFDTLYLNERFGAVQRPNILRLYNVSMGFNLKVQIYQPGLDCNPTQSHLTSHLPVLASDAVRGFCNSSIYS